MWYHASLTSHEVKILIRDGRITFGGHRRLKIYGSLRCNTGKRMSDGHRVFFIDEEEAKANGYRPCGHCMRTAYQAWKKEQVRKKQVESDDLANQL